jgi:hypothetical protein
MRKCLIAPGRRKPSVIANRASFFTFDVWGCQGSRLLWRPFGDGHWDRPVTESVTTDVMRSRAGRAPAWIWLLVAVGTLACLALAETSGPRVTSAPQDEESLDLAERLAQEETLDLYKNILARKRISKAGDLKVRPVHYSLIQLARRFLDWLEG